jgi:hypothetical protein
LVERAAMAIFDKAWRLIRPGDLRKLAGSKKRPLPIALTGRFGAVEHAQTRHIVKRSEELLAVLK